VLSFLTVVCLLSAINLVANQRMVPPPAVSQELFAPYWTAEPGWHTELQLRNGRRSMQVVVTPILRLSSGQTYSLTPVSINPSDVVSIDVRQELEKIAPQILDQPGTFGSVIVRFIAPNYGNINAAVMVHEMGQPIGYHIDAFAEDPDYTAGSREGIWWLPRAETKDNLIISNASNKANQGTLYLYDATGKAWNQSWRDIAHDAGANTIQRSIQH
ncbi:MAG TPA: hypothetical protein VGG15_11850, partial [Terriglobales bacterium]